MMGQDITLNSAKGMSGCKHGALWRIDITDRPRVSGSPKNHTPSFGPTSLIKRHRVVSGREYR